MIENVLFDVSEALRVPVLVLALAALALVLFEAGALLFELSRRRRRSLWALERAVGECRGRLAAGQPAEGLGALLPFAASRRAEEALATVVDQVGRPGAEARIAKRLAEFDYGNIRRLERTRILVRMGPALGLMGTLIPLSPALAASPTATSPPSPTTSGRLQRHRRRPPDRRRRLWDLARPRPPLRRGLLRPRVRRRQPHRTRRQRAPRHQRQLGGGAVKVNPRARRHEDRAGDPLDGLVNLFDLGIVLSVAFLLAALSSLDLTSALTGKATSEKRTRPADAVTAPEDSKVKQVELQPGEKVVGRGKAIGTVYRLADGRTVIVRDPGARAR